VELPRLNELYRKYQDQGLQVIAVEGFRDRKRATEFIKKSGLEFPCLENGEGAAEFVSSSYKISGYPSSFLVDAEGKVMFYHYGYDEGDDLKMEQEIKRMLAD
jgi:peroxiredoxin